MMFGSGAFEGGVPCARGDRDRPGGEEGL